MSNLGYCRFQNTLSDLQDCSEHIYDELEGAEDTARNELVATCQQILEALDYEVVSPDEEDE